MTAKTIRVISYKTKNWTNFYIGHFTYIHALSGKRVLRHFNLWLEIQLQDALFKGQRYLFTTIA